MVPGLNLAKRRLWTPAHGRLKPLAWVDVLDPRYITLSGSNITSFTCRQTGIVLALDAGATNATWSATGMSSKRPGAVFNGASRYGAALRATHSLPDFALFAMVNVDNATQGGTGGGGFGQIFGLWDGVNAIWNDGHNMGLMAQSGPPPNCTAWRLSGGTSGDVFVTGTIELAYAASRDASDVTVSRQSGLQERSRSVTSVAGQANVYLGGDVNDNNYHYVGKLGEAVALPYEPNALSQERVLYEGYFFWRWGVPDRLPAGHRFRSGPPTLPMAV
jgi:hypothetical protein